MGFKLSLFSLSIGNSRRPRKSRRPKMPLAYRTRKGKRVWDFGAPDDAPIENLQGWDHWKHATIEDLPQWVQNVLAERPDDIGSYLINGKTYQYLYHQYQVGHGFGGDCQIFRRLKP